MRGVTVKAPAKLNLALDITGIAPNGYHTMDMVMQTVNLYETVTLHRATGITVTLPGSRVAGGPGNTASKAALAFFNETGLLAGVDITIHKKIPVRAGMAGGSADAAAVLVGLNALYGAKLSVPQLCSMGAAIGADVPFSILGGTARVGGIGEILTPIAPCVPCFFVVCMPAFGVSTPEAFARYDLLGTDTHPAVGALQSAIEHKDYAAMCAAMGNALMASSSAKATNDDICATLCQNGADTALMTGSGAAVFGVFANEEAAHAAKRILRKKYAQTWVLTPCAHGAQVTEY